MAFFTGRTPESLIPRSDSRNPATTCKGVTKSGRPCRRAIDAKDTSHDNGVLAVVSLVNDDDEDETGAAAFFCWQHKDQAQHLVAANSSGLSRQDTQLYPLQERNSIDSLVARLGVLDVGDQNPNQRRKKKQNKQDAANIAPNRLNRPPTWNKVQGPLMSVPSDVMAERRRRRTYQQPEVRPERKKQGFWASLCCGSADDEYMEVVKHKRPTHNQPSSTAPQMQEQSRPQAPRPTQQNKPSNGSAPSSAQRPPVSTPGRKPTGPLSQTPQPAETSTMLSFVPKTASPQTTSALVAQLAKPISKADEEGYIYIFWLTEESKGPAPSSTASTLLAPPTQPQRGRRTSDVLRQYSVRKPQRPDAARNRSGGDTSQDSEPEKNTILLKIGRANNVTRRMNEWTRQCGYSLSLVRYYPYVSSTPTPSPQASPAHSRHASYNGANASPSPSRGGSDGARKVPYAHRVERLIHIELAQQRVVKKCEACGKEHKEWFEVEATKEGVAKVDEVIKRWVEWSEWVERTGGA